ncbi:hypothetical protein M3226_04315 [Neobacillus cucumis]|nr:hypothetical protein [Neobacillus cucumis]MCM3724922.1 hypothetical protein [Neobacillus cucumis]
MAISENLNEQKLKEILTDIYISGMEQENMHVSDLIEEIKKQLLVYSK